MRVPVQAVDRDPRYRPKTEVPAQNLDRDPHQTFARGDLDRTGTSIKPLQGYDLYRSDLHQTFARVPTCTGARDLCKPTE